MNLSTSSLPQQVPVQSPPAAPKKNKTESKKHRARLDGRLKFFDRAKKYGFIVNEETNEDIFVHYDDLKKAGLEVQLRDFDQNMLLKVQFCIFEYSGKAGRIQKKAVDIKMTQFKPSVDESGEESPDAVEQSPTL